MTTKELKTEIQKALKTVPESVMVEVLDYLKAFNGQTEGRGMLAKQLRTILSEDKDLLARLAK